MRNVLPAVLLVVLAVVVPVGCSSPNQPGRYVQMQGYADQVLDTQTGAIFLYRQSQNGWTMIAPAMKKELLSFASSEMYQR